MKQFNVAVIGLGYVGLPLAVEFARKYSVIGFDVDKKRVLELNEGIDITLHRGLRFLRHWPEDVCYRFPTSHQCGAADKAEGQDCYPTVFGLPGVDDHRRRHTQSHGGQQLIRNTKHGPDG